MSPNRTPLESFSQPASRAEDGPRGFINRNRPPGQNSNLQPPVFLETGALPIEATDLKIGVAELARNTSFLAKTLRLFAVTLFTFLHIKKSVWPTAKRGQPFVDDVVSVSNMPCAPGPPSRLSASPFFCNNVSSTMEATPTGHEAFFAALEFRPTPRRVNPVYRGDRDPRHVRSGGCLSSQVSLP